MKDMHMSTEMPILCYANWKATFHVFRKYLIEKPIVHATLESHMRSNEKKARASIYTDNKFN
jgi:hypothetical protein